ncbi:hypothetical protein AVEN_191635-1 [Araneus ventricosus]|uniref:Uncharacterized protein n=1 Tax=Araneus ventricosus TaxID=182803 RepID=A0A4Y2P6J1_ARAVE|nr:hypothetical protein AVEN_191635-1 [Araneus ventricosus]
MMMIGSSVDYVRSGGMRNVPVTKAVEHSYATTAKFSGCVNLASRPAYSYPPRRLLDLKVIESICSTMINSFTYEDKRQTYSSYRDEVTFFALFQP